MCGISGVIAVERDRAIDRDAVERLADLMTHRGPDSRGAIHHERFSFACRRLAITDPEPRSNQPFSDPEGSVTVVFNGEIYNHGSLREELSQLGARFRTRSDTEVIVEAYKRWGAQCLERFNGMFAFALYDGRAGTFLIARDPTGVKPLYYAVLNGALIFGSEIQAVAGYPGFRRELTAEAIVRFLRFRYVPFGDQYYRGLRKLGPGCALIVERGEVAVRSWWDVPAAPAQRDADATAVSELIADAIALQLRSRERASLFLSGGTDSSILALHARASGVPGMVAFTARVPGPAYDESSAAAVMASASGLEHRVVEIEPIVSLAPVRRLIGFKGQPLGMHNELAMAELAAAAVKHSKVALCGEGADELFAGYSRIFRSPWNFFRRSLMRLDAASGLTTGMAVPPFWRFVFDRYFYTPDTDLLQWLRPEFHHLLQDPELSQWIQSASERFGPADRFQQVCYFFLKLHLPGLLEMVDSSTMSVGLEARVPFTDRRLVETVFALPARRKLKWRSSLHAAAAAFLPLHLWSGVFDVPKAILKEAYAKRLPHGVFEQRKKGFPIPLRQWLNRNAEVGSLLTDRHSPLHEFFLPNAFQHLISAQANPKTEDALGRRLWLIANLALFLEKAA